MHFLVTVVLVSAAVTEAETICISRLCSDDRWETTICHQDAGDAVDAFCRSQEACLLEAQLGPCHTLGYMRVGTLLTWFGAGPINAPV